jgi:3-dehydroquinate synthase
VTEEIATLPVALGERSYDILIGHGLLDRAGELVGPRLGGRRVVIVTDEHLEAAGHAGSLRAALAQVDIRQDTVTVPAGESSKSLGRLEPRLEEILGLGVDRRATLVALGGGVVGDLAGFAAAVLLRGIDLVQIPTTLLAQVDSSVGGKTAVNSRLGKNLIGAFHQPRLVLVDTGTLGTLPERELKAGYAELVKHALIEDAGLFDWLEGAAPRLLGGDAPLLQEAIRRSVAIKARIVGEDERETSGRRALLNLGHTFAHAYETLAGYGGGLLHGEAVALGMARAFDLSVRLGLCPAADARRAVRHLRAAGLPVAARDVRNEGFAPDAAIEIMRRDKKVQDDRLTFVLSAGIGRALLRNDVPVGVLREVLAADA